MKTTMRRTVAFMLMVCLLLSVMAPVTFKAEAATTEGNVTSYDIVDGGGLITEGKTNAKLNATNNNLGDFTYLAKADDIANAFVYTDETNGYLFGCAGFKLSTAAWLAVKFNVEAAGEYKLNVLKTAGDADIAVVKYSDWTGDVSALSVLGDIDETYELTLEKNDYVLVMQANYEGNHFRIAGMTLEKKAVVEPAAASYDFCTENEAWTSIITRKTDSNGTFTNSDAAGNVLAVQLNQEMGAGVYKLDLVVRHYASGGLQEVYMIPNSAFTGAIDKDAILQNMTSDYYVGTVDCYTTPKTNLSVISELATTDTYVLALKSIEGNNGVYRACIQALDLTPAYKVVNDTYYTVAEAVAAGETNLTLSGDITEDITLTKGETLDLNGNTVTGDVNVVVGNVTDSGATKGGVKGAVDLQSSNSAIALLDNDTYRFFEYDLVNVGENNAKKRDDGSVNFGFGLFFEDAAAYDYVANGGLTISATLTWSGSKTGSAVIGGMNEAIAAWIDAKPTSDDGRCFYIKVTGLYENLEAGDVVTVTPSFTYANGVSGSFGGAITHTVG